MTLNELRFVVAVAQERNFRRAAERSFISQPALSLAIQKLEEELGVRIFERGKNEVSITPARVPRGARISAGKSGKVATSLPASADVLVNCVPSSCIPSPESPASLTVIPLTTWTCLVACACGVSVDIQRVPVLNQF